MISTLRKAALLLVFTAVLTPSFVCAQKANDNSELPASSAYVYSAPQEVIDRIRDEGLTRSQVMQPISYLSNVIGSRLTNSPGMRRANVWTRDTLTKWGMTNARLEPWGEFGRGWSLKTFSAQVVWPDPFAVIAYPKAWTPSTKGSVTAEVVHLDVRTDADLDRYRGKLRGKIVLVSDLREVKPAFDGMAARLNEKELTEHVAAEPTKPPSGESAATKTSYANYVKTMTKFHFAVDEGAAVVVEASPRGSGGTLFVQAARSRTEIPKSIEEFFNTGAARPRPHLKKDESGMVPQIVMAVEDYNRLVRMISLGERPRMTIDIKGEYHYGDLKAYNTIAEIPGSDPALKDEIVMVGGHLDSWHASGGATDNAAGVAVAMEAVRIIKVLGLNPRRTIRIALWSGEEQGLLGSRAYVKKHFGGNSGTVESIPSAKTPEHDKLSAYYNLDHGTGKIRGVYLQGNSAVRPIFEKWFTPFHDLDVKTMTMASTFGSDHLAFDEVGLPGFYFLQDEIEYETRTHHSNQDNFDRIQPDDMKQAATIMAAFVYQTAMMDQKMPRKIFVPAAK